MGVGHTADWEGPASDDGYVDLELHYSADGPIRLRVKVFKDETAARIANLMGVQWITRTGAWVNVDGAKVTFPPTLDGLTFREMYGKTDQSGITLLPDGQRKDLKMGLHCTRRDQNNWP